MTDDEIADFKARLKRWITACGQPSKLGRADPDNDDLYLMRDALSTIEALEQRINKYKR